MNCLAFHRPFHYFQSDYDANLSAGMGVSRGITARYDAIVAFPRNLSSCY